jgi:hypothetical protein
MMERRLAAHIPVVLFTIRWSPARTARSPATIKMLLHSTDWVNHLLFSPTDPNLDDVLPRGHGQKVDRIWMIHTDGTHNTLIHKRTMLMEIAGHEFWGLDGETIWYDWQYPKGEDFFLASYNLKTGSAPPITCSATSGRFTSTSPGPRPLLRRRRRSRPGGQAKDGEWIELFRPQMIGGEGRAQRPQLLAAGRLPLRAPGQHVAPLLSRGAQPALLAGQVAGHLHQQYVRASYVFAQQPAQETGRSFLVVPWQREAEKRINHQRERPGHYEIDEIMLSRAQRRQHREDHKRERNNFCPRRKLLGVPPRQQNPGHMQRWNGVARALHYHRMQRKPHRFCNGKWMQRKSRGKQMDGAGCRKEIVKNPADRPEIQKRKKYRSAFFPCCSKLST